MSELLGLGVLGPQAVGPRKSGMPEPVEMPAPVSTATDRAERNSPRAWSRATGSAGSTSIQPACPIAPASPSRISGLTDGERLVFTETH